MSSIRISVLGQIEVTVDESKLILTGKQLGILLMLLDCVGETVSTESLLDGVWGQTRADNAVGSLRNSVMTLRRALEPVVRVTSARGGYRLEPADGAALVVDGHALDELRDAAESAMAAARYDDAEAAVSQALGLWRAEPLTGVSGPWAEAERHRLRGVRGWLRETAAEIALRRGRHLEVRAELQAMAAADPYNERVQALLMTALSRSGRRADALEVYQRTRRLLVDELGIDPGPNLVEVHRRVLDDMECVPESVSTRLPSPAQLPSATADFTGRSDLVQALVDRLGGSETAATASISGMSGIGKTTLAVHVAHMVRDRYPDGQLYADLCGADPVPRAPSQVLGGFLRALGIGDADIPDDLVERSALFRSAVCERAVLVVLDDAAGVDQIVPLLPGGPRCAVLITSRSPIPLPGALTMRLDVLGHDDAVALFTRIVGDERVAAEPEATRRVVSLCGLLPMAVRIVAARINSRPQWPIAAETGRLVGEHADLDSFRVGDIALEAAFRSGYEQLDAEQARAFRLLADAEIPRLTLPAVAAILIREPRRAERLCETLTDRGLLESTGHQRYRYHDLMRIFARGCPNPDDEDALLRLIDFTLATAKNILTVRLHGDALIPILADTIASGTAPADFAQSEALLESERRNCVALYQLACTRGGPHHRRLAADLALAVAETFSATGPTVDLAGALTTLIDALDADHATEAALRARMALAMALIHEHGDMPQGLAVLHRARADMRAETHQRLIASGHGLAAISAIHDGDVTRATTEFAAARGNSTRPEMSPECAGSGCSRRCSSPIPATTVPRWRPPPARYPPNHPTGARRSSRSWPAARPVPRCAAAARTTLAWRSWAMPCTSPNTSKPHDARRSSTATSRRRTAGPGASTKPRAARISW